MIEEIKQFKVGDTLIVETAEYVILAIYKLIDGTDVCTAQIIDTEFCAIFKLDHLNIVNPDEIGVVEEEEVNEDHQIVIGAKYE